MLPLQETNAVIKETLYGSDQSHKWWTTLKFALSGVDSSVSLLVKPDGCVTHSPTEKATPFANICTGLLCKGSQSVSVLFNNKCFSFVHLTAF